MTKRKASSALADINESNLGNHDQDTGNSNNSAINNGHPQMTQNGSSSSSNGQQISNDQNDSNSTNGRSSNDNNSCAGSAGLVKSKKERADNWSNAEIQVLHRGIESRRDIFYGPPSQATKKNRELAWDAITKEVNSVSTTPRSLSQVMKKFKNEKCRAKRKFTDIDKDNHNHPNLGPVSQTSSRNSLPNTSTTSASNETTNMNAQSHQNFNHQPIAQQQTQSHHMTNNDSVSASQTSINVVKLAPQNIAKTMIDLPGHVQQIQMPNDDMLLIVNPPEMDGLLSGMNIVSDGTNHHHFQKCTNSNVMSNHQGNHQNQGTIQSLGNSQGIVNGTMSNGMMARTIPAGSMCSLVYSTGSEVCSTDQHISGIPGHNTISTSHIGVNAQNLMHHRGGHEQSENQQHQSHQHHHQLHQHQPQTHAHQPIPIQHQSQHQMPHNQPQLPQNHLPAATISNTGGVAVESQLKNLLFNLLLKDGSNTSSNIVNSNQESAKQRNDILAIIANSLNKIECHLGKISKVATALLTQNINVNLNDGDVLGAAQLNTSTGSVLNMDGEDGTGNGNNTVPNTVVSNTRNTET